MPFSLGPILLVKLAKQSKIARFCQNVDAQWCSCYGQVVRHVPFVVGIHLVPLTSKVVPIKTKIWKQGTTKKDKASTKKLLLFRNLGWHPHYQSDSKTVAIQDKHKTKKYDEIFAFYWSYLAYSIVFVLVGIHVVGLTSGPINLPLLATTPLTSYQPLSQLFPTSGWVATKIRHDYLFFFPPNVLLL